MNLRQQAPTLRNRDPGCHVGASETCCLAAEHNCKSAHNMHANATVFSLHGILHAYACIHAPYPEYFQCTARHLICHAGVFSLHGKTCYFLRIVFVTARHLIFRRHLGAKPWISSSPHLIASQSLGIQAMKTLIHPRSTCLMVPWVPDGADGRSTCVIFRRHLGADPFGASRARRPIRRCFIPAFL